MAVATLDAGGLAMRVAAVFLFVLVTVPYGILYAFILPEELSAPAIPLIVLLILIICTHIYFVYRAYYALKISGFLVFTAVYALISYYIAYLLGLEVSDSGMRWNIVGYLTLLYGYGVCYNTIDGYISGLLHTKGV